MPLRSVLPLGIIAAFFTLPCLKAVGQQCVNDRLRIEVDATTGGGSISVELKNDSEKPLKIFKTTNGWGANRYWVQVIRKARVYGFFEESKDAYFYTHPGFSEIAPHSRLERSLDLNDGNWGGRRGRRFALQSGDRVVVLYDVPFTKAAEKFNVWCGFVGGTAIVP